ncbi:MAG: PQQ-like beta-propeller repeat protein, partial [Nannocystaceae bacterium]|nr:PQQ-like beta-propeller repeat protein [Nannocystaceae bacterium]
VHAGALRRIADAPAGAVARAPVIIRGEGGSVVAVQGAGTWSLLGLDGTLRWRGAGEWLAALDVDRDGRDEVLLRERDTVVLHDDDGASRWSMPASQYRGVSAWHDDAVVLRQDDDGVAVVAADTLALRVALAGTRGRVELGATVDWDGDGTRELAIVDDAGVTAFDRRGRRRDSVALEVRPERIAATADANGDRSDDLLLEAKGPMLVLGPRILWRRRSTDAIRAAPVVADLDRDGTLELALFGGFDGGDAVLTVLDARTGMVEQRGSIGGSAVIRSALLDREGGAPSLLAVVGNELVRFGGDAGVLARVATGGAGYASLGWVGAGEARALAWIDWSGRLSRWRPDTLQRELAVELGAGSWSPPLELATATGTLWIVSLLDGTLRGLDPRSGAERWRVALGARNAFAPLLADADGDGAPELVTVAGEGVDRRERPQDLVGLSPGDGAQRWRMADAGWSRSRPVWSAAAGAIVFATRDGKVVARGLDGRERWRFDVGAAVDASTALVRADLEHDGHDEIIAGFADGRVRVLDGEHGTLRWGFDAGDEIEAPPVPVDVDGDGIDELLVGSHDRSLSCLRHLR